MKHFCYNRIYNIQEHPIENNCSEWGNERFQWANCYDCDSTLLRPKSYFDTHKQTRIKKEVQRDIPHNGRLHRVIFEYYVFWKEVGK